MSGVRRGRLPGGASAPVSGEHVERLLADRGVTVEHILSGELELPVEYFQDDDEWVTVVEGEATLDVDGETIEMTAGAWVFLPRRTPHRLLEVRPGTRWLAVHIGTTADDRQG